MLVTLSLFSTLLMAIPVAGPVGTVSCPKGLSVTILPGGTWACNKDGCVFVLGDASGIGDI